MIAGAREGTLSGLRRLVAAAMARDLGTFVVPGPDIARASGLDLEAAGLHVVASPRHASVLLLVGNIPPALCEAAAVVYAQMPRPRALFIAGAETPSPLPDPDIRTGISQRELVDGVRRLRAAFAEGAFRPQVSDFDAPVLQIRMEYTCPMHPEVVRDEPGSCPKCGMDLVPREVQAGAGHVHAVHEESHGSTGSHATPPRALDADHAAAVEYTCPMHPEVVQNEPGKCPKCGMNLEPRETQPQPTHEHAHTDHVAAVEYTCPMHPEVVQNEPGKCPRCGMNLEPREVPPEHGEMDHGAMDHGDMDFMSMIEVTKDLPRSSDGLPMEWVETPFGPFFPGLPGGLLLTLTLDGDTVARSDANSLAADRVFAGHLPMDVTPFVESMTNMDPLAPVSYRLLACRALENSTGVKVADDIARTRAGALERERIASHLGWLALLGQQTGFAWLQESAASLQLKIRDADAARIAALAPDIQSLGQRVRRTPLLKSRMRGIGPLVADKATCGPVARAAGDTGDARSTEPAYTAIGFAPAMRKEGDALARLQLRLDEIMHSLALIEAAGATRQPEPAPIDAVSGQGESLVETPRGPARLVLTLESGQVTTARLETPSTVHIGLVGALVEQQELGDALTAVCSLDLSPWEIQP